MAHANTNKAVFYALIGNAIISILKFIAAFFTMSTSMLAEAIHSTSDCLNQIFLLIGNKRSKKKNDEEHPFGYGREEFFWAFMVAISARVVYVHEMDNYVGKSGTVVIGTTWPGVFQIWTYPTKEYLAIQREEKLKELGL